MSERLQNGKVVQFVEIDGIPVENQLNQPGLRGHRVFNERSATRGFGTDPGVCSNS